ncbi:hypothetical protein OF83DRAFT_529674 [Amylostereum chailletii]|nr:hypothetical protein OF83DRAFT_529674 [Amylostereum chailletii]
MCTVLLYVPALHEFPTCTFEYSHYGTLRLLACDICHIPYCPPPLAFPDSATPRKPAGHVFIESMGASPIAAASTRPVTLMENDICDCRNDTQVSSVRAASTSTRLSPESRLIVFSAIVLPVALAPLIVLRRSLVALHRKVDASYAASQALQRELKATLLDMSVRRDEHRQLKTLVGGLRRRIDELSKEAHKSSLHA